MNELKVGWVLGAQVASAVYAAGIGFGLWLAGAASWVAGAAGVCAVGVGVHGLAWTLRLSRLLGEER